LAGCPNDMYADEEMLIYLYAVAAKEPVEMCAADDVLGLDEWEVMPTMDWDEYPGWGVDSDDKSDGDWDDDAVWMSSEPSGL
jgi:hypothetical protein